MELGGGGGGGVDSNRELGGGGGDLSAYNSLVNYPLTLPFTFSVSLISASVKPKNNMRRFSSILLLSSGNDAKIKFELKMHKRVHCACTVLVIGNAC